MRWLLPVLLLAAACGGGGGSGPLPPIEQGMILGTVRADAPTPINVTIPNPLAADATAEEAAGSTGPFAPDAGELPAAVAEGADLWLRVLLTPPGPGAQSGEIHLRFVAGKQEREVVIKLSAIVETANISLLTPVLSFPTLLIGDESSLDIRVRNPNQFTPVKVTSIGTFPADFTTDFLPRTLAPGDTAVFQVTYAPQAPSSFDFDVQIVNDVGAPLAVRVIAGADTWPAEQVTDFGTVTFSGGQTVWLEVDVPPDAISVSIEGVASSASAVPGLLGFEGPGGKVYENAQATGEFLWVPGTDGVFAATLPQSDNPNVQLVPGGGIYRFRLYLLGGSAGSVAVRAIVENRPGAVPDQSQLDVNVFLTPALNIASPSTDTKLQAVLSRMDDIFAQVDLRVGTVDYYQLSNTAYNSVSDSEFAQLLAESSVASAARMNIFFVQTAIGGGVIGIAGELPGPKRNGLPVSGVMVDYDWSDAAAVGQIAAHEVGHFLGLYHTAESDGFTFDIISDTLECPAQCTSANGGYLMHWQYFGSSMPTITAGQAGAILGHPLVDPAPALAGLSALAQKKAPAPAFVQLPPGFCGTCKQHK